MAEVYRGRALRRRDQTLGIRRAGKLRRETSPVIHFTERRALGMFNMTNQHTFAAIFQRDMGTKGDVAGRRAMVTDMILRYVATPSA